MKRFLAVPLHHPAGTEVQIDRADDPRRVESRVREEVLVLCCDQGQDEVLGESVVRDVLSVFLLEEDPDDRDTVVVVHRALQCEDPLDTFPGDLLPGIADDEDLVPRPEPCHQEEKEQQQPHEGPRDPPPTAPSGGLHRRLPSSKACHYLQNPFFLGATSSPEISASSLRSSS